jgi:hypothetical protein
MILCLHLSISSVSNIQDITLLIIDESECLLAIDESCNSHLLSSLFEQASKPEKLSSLQWNNTETIK